MTSLLTLLLFTTTLTVGLAMLNHHDGLPWSASHRTPPRSHPDGF